MESINTIVPRIMNGLTPRRPFTLKKLIEQLEEEERHDNADVVLPLHELRMIDGEHLAVPDGRAFQLNDWSRRQTSSLLGLRWDRWFENASGDAVAEEVNRRLHRAGGEVRIRTRSRPNYEPEVRAVVTPGYTPVSDSMVARGVLAAIGHFTTDPTVVRAHVTERTTSFVIGVGEPYRPGGDGRVGEVWGGLVVRNSNTGFAALGIQLYLTRLVCLNGMTVPHEEAVLRRVHRGLDVGDLESKLYAKLRDLPARLRKGTDTLAATTRIPVNDVVDEIGRFLESARLPRRLAPQIEAAYKKEQHPSAFGIVQAITLAAQSLEAEDRYELERAAGTYAASSLS
jgi:hypothetical protein